MERQKCKRKIIKIYKNYVDRRKKVWYFLIKKRVSENIFFVK